MEIKITKELIDELLQWGKERLEKKDYPKEAVQLSVSHRTPNCEIYINAMLHTLTRQWENPLFHPLVEEFYEFREKIQQL